MAKMSDLCKETMIKEFGFTDPELIQIENFMNKHNNRTARDILDYLIKDKELNDRQKIIISYVVGNSVGQTLQEDPIMKKVEIPKVPNFGG